MHADNYKGEAKAFLVNIRVWRSVLTESIYLGQNEVNFLLFFFPDQTSLLSPK